MLNRYELFYPRKIWVACKETKETLAELFEGYDGEELDFDEIDDVNILNACCWKALHKETKEYGILIFVRKKSTTNDIAHEATHAALYIYEDIGSDITDQEPFAYLVGYIAECIEKTKNGR